MTALQPYSFEAKSLNPRAHRPSLASQLALKILPPSSKTGVTGSLLSPLGICVASGDLDPSPLAFPESASYWAIFPTLLDVSFDTVFEHGMSYCCQDFWMTSLWKQCLTTAPTPCLQSGSWFLLTLIHRNFHSTFNSYWQLPKNLTYFFVAKVIPDFFVLSNIYLSIWPHFSFLFSNCFILRLHMNICPILQII